MLKLKLHPQLKTGFTIVEASLFIAISGFIVISVIAGTSSIVSRQRYNDSVQDFTEFLRRSYSEVINVQNLLNAPLNIGTNCTTPSMVNLNNNKFIQKPENYIISSDPSRVYHPGRSDCAIYGRIITFGEDQTGKVRSYDIIGRAINSGDFSQETSTLSVLEKVGADISTIEVSRGSNHALTCKYRPIAGSAEYSPQWGAKIEKGTPEPEPLTATIMIIRSPISGAIHTYSLVKPNPSAPGGKATFAPKFHRLFNGQETLNCTGGEPAGINNAKDKHLFLSQLFRRKSNTDPNPYFEQSEIDFCIGSDDVFATGNARRNIRLAKDGRNASAVNLLNIDDGSSFYQDNPNGNRCL